MYSLLSIIFIGVGFIMLINPKFIFELTEGWKNNSDSEPSDLYIFSVRVGGIIALILGFAGIIFL